jgi:hypothetical protein
MRSELLYRAVTYQVHRHPPRARDKSKGGEGHEFERRYKGQCLPFYTTTRMLNTESS